MFDVSWTDPSRETVGQRKTRKESKIPQVENLSSSSSASSSTSNSSQTQNWSSLLTLFGSTNTNSKKTIKRTGSHSKLSTIRSEEKILKASRRVSSYTVSSILSEQCSATSPAPHTNFFAVEPYHFDTDQSSGSDGDVTKSVFSNWTGRSRKTQSTWSSVADASHCTGTTLHAMSDGSFVSRSPDSAVFTRDSIRADEQVATLVSFTAPPPVPIEIKDGSRKGAFSPASHPQFPNAGEIRPDGIAESPIIDPDGFVLATSPTLGTLDAREIEWPIPPRFESSGSDNYQNISTESNTRDESPSSSPVLLGLPLVPLRSTKRRPPPLELSHLQRNIRRMDGTSTKIVLEHLKEEWLEAVDASIYREMELEKQLWMLTALEHLRKKTLRDMIDLPTRASMNKPKGISKLLSLYENHASASLLSAIHPLSRIHHISTSPLSSTFYPNIQPLAVPSPTPHLPYASNLFTSIHAFSLPAVLPASLIPPMLRECHRTLRSTRPPSILPLSLRPPSPSSPISFSSSSTRTITSLKQKQTQKPGSIHLTILDPAPLPDTLGPKLRSWLDEHLILNLERQFRCINPGRLLPIWLADAGLRGEGSKIVNVNFRAAMNATTTGAEVTNDEGDAISKQELKSVVGRLLWKEMWGPFVEGDKWWWEDDEVLEECLRMETRWEYSVIEGVREG